jgi:hypothetical protein
MVKVLYENLEDFVDCLSEDASVFLITKADATSIIKLTSFGNGFVMIHAILANTATPEAAQSWVKENETKVYTLIKTKHPNADIIKGEIIE